MAEQPRPWGDRTLQVPPQDPWADAPTAEAFPSAPPTPIPTSGGPTSGGPASGGPASGGPGGVGSGSFHRGVAHVTPRPPRTDGFGTQSFPAAHEPTGTGWPDAAAPAPRRSAAEQMRLLRLGGEWSTAGILFLGVCWGIWAISSNGTNRLVPVLVLAVVLVVAVGLFTLTRLVGRMVLERLLRRVRRTARGAHLVVALFLAGVGVGFLQQTEWVVQAWNWVAGAF